MVKLLREGRKIMDAKSTLVDDDVVRLYVTKFGRQQRKQNVIKSFFNENDIKYEERFVEEISEKEFRTLLEELLCVIYNIDEYKRPLQDILFCNSKAYNITNETSLHEMIDTLCKNRHALALPVAFKKTILIRGGNLQDYERLLVGDSRDNIKWLGGDRSLSDEEKIDWVAKNFAMPKIINISSGGRENLRNATILYMPDTSVVYGGKIKWIYPKSIINKEFKAIKKTNNLRIKMIMTLGNVTKEFEFISRAV